MKLFATLLILFLTSFNLSAAEPAADKAANEKVVSAVEIYAQPNSAVGIRTLMGQLVNLEVLVTIARDVPLVEISKPEGDKRVNPVKAHLVSVTSEASSLKKDQRYLIKGIIVDEGYDAYVIYLHEAAAAK